MWTHRHEFRGTGWRLLGKVESDPQAMCVVHQLSTRSWALRASALIVMLWCAAVASAEDQRYGIGQPANASQIRAWDIDIAPTGEGLPPGRGTVARGAEIFAKKCASCHGPTGVEGPADRLVGGQGSLRSPEPSKTVGSYWPYATTLYDYIFRAMPFTTPQSLSPDEVYSLVAWILARNGIIPDDAIMDRTTLPKIRMPNRDGFVSDPRPDISSSFTGSSVHGTDVQRSPGGHPPVHRQ